jgi:hypothetical protein
VSVTCINSSIRIHACEVFICCIITCVYLLEVGDFIYFTVFHYMTRCLKSRLVEKLIQVTHSLLTNGLWIF